MSKLSKFVTKLFAFFATAIKSVNSVYEALNEDMKKLVPVAVNAVQAAKVVVWSNTGESLKNVIIGLCPSTAGDAVIELAYAWLKDKGLPYLLTGLQVSEAILQIEDKEKQLVAVLNVLDVADDKSEKYLHLAAGILEALSDGKLSFVECQKIAGEYYDNFVKLKTLTPPDGRF